jgi:hypothetical protein
VDYHWGEVLRAARESGEAAIAAAIERMFERQRAFAAWSKDLGWKGAVRRFDRRFLGSAMSSARRRWAPR